MSREKKESWQHHVFIIEKERMNTKLSECEFNYNRESDRQKCYADIRKHRKMR